MKTKVEHPKSTKVRKKRRDPHAAKTIFKHDRKYRAYRRHGKNFMSPLGIRYSQLHKRATRPAFRSFEKCNTIVRGRMYYSGKIDYIDLLIMRYARGLLNQSNRRIMQIPKLEYLRKKPLGTLLKWPGGKTSDLKHLRTNFTELFPIKIDNYYEPFLGGGAVWLAAEPHHKLHVNDFSADLINFYNCIKSQDATFFSLIEKMGKAWSVLHELAVRMGDQLYAGEQVLEAERAALQELALADDDLYSVISKIVADKLKRITKVEEKKQEKLNPEDRLSNIEGALKAGYYTYVRSLFNHHKPMDALRAATFYFLRDYCFSSMFRFSSKGDFNVPYGGISYNGRSPAARVEYWKSEALRQHLQQTEFHQGDFEEFLDEVKPTKDDFMFIDPPYDSEFSTYDKKEFGLPDQKRLADWLIKSQVQFIAVMKNTQQIHDLYKDREKDGIRCVVFDKNYTVSFKNRNEQKVEHLVVYRINH